MKTIITLATVITIITIVSCKKEKHPGPESGTYSSLNNFYVQNGVPLQTYNINGTTGGTFTSPQGTVVIIPPNAFITQAGAPVPGNVIVEFKDIYKKSDMLLSDKTTNMYWGRALKSGGEFFIKAISGGSPVLLASGKKITANQPASLTGDVDTTMGAYVLLQDSAAGLGNWYGSQYNNVVSTAYSYVYSLFQFSQPDSSGTWSNTDSPYPFASYVPNVLTLHPIDDPKIFSMDVFLVFSNITTVVHVYRYGFDFPDYYAPVGMQCTAVVIGLKDGKLYSSFVPITISANQTVNFSLSETSTKEFRAKLQTLN